MNNRKSTFTNLKEFCIFAKDSHFIEATEWVNGEGFTVTLENKTKQLFDLTYGEFDALKKVVKKLNKTSI